MATYEINKTIHIAEAFLNTSSAAADPTTVVFKYRARGGTIVSYAYSTDAQLVRDSLGNYHVDLSLTVPGLWEYEFLGTGTVAQATNGSFLVSPNAFDS